MASKNLKMESKILEIVSKHKNRDKNLKTEVEMGKKIQHGVEKCVQNFNKKKKHDQNFKMADKNFYNRESKTRNCDQKFKKKGQNSSKN